MAKINRLNSKGQRHGFWKGNYYKCHYKNHVLDGYDESVWRKGYYKNGKKIGIVFSGTCQFFCGQQNVFGERLIWEIKKNLKN